MNELSYYLDTCPDFIKNNFSFEKFNFCTDYTNITFKWF